MAEGDYYKGDLLKSVLTSDPDFWKTQTNLKQQVIALFEDNIVNLKEMETSDRIRLEIFEAFSSFKK